MHKYIYSHTHTHTHIGCGYNINSLQARASCAKMSPESHEIWPFSKNHRKGSICHKDKQFEFPIRFRTELLLLQYNI